MTLGPLATEMLYEEIEARKEEPARARSVCAALAQLTEKGTVDWKELHPHLVFVQPTDSYTGEPYMDDDPDLDSVELHCPKCGALVSAIEGDGEVFIMHCDSCPWCRRVDCTSLLDLPGADGIDIGGACLCGLDD